MIEFICSLVLFLSQDCLAVEDIVTRIGSIVHDPGVPMPIELRPSMSSILTASVSRYPDSGLPYTVTLEFQTDAQPSIAAFNLAFGDFRRMLTYQGMPAEVFFLPPHTGTLWNVAVIAEVAPHIGGLESALVASVTLRRDPS
jgi:hypothetical protein